PAAHACETVAHERVDCEEGGADGIGSQHKGERLRRKDLAAGVNEGGQVLEELPDFALRPAAISGRIEKDDVVELAATHLALGEFLRVLANPADRLVG